MKFVIRKSEDDVHDSMAETKWNTVLKHNVEVHQAEAAKHPQAHPQAVMPSDAAGGVKFLVNDDQRGTYETINRKSWDAILRTNEYDWQPPVTVRLPIQPVHSPDFVHVDCALNVCRRKVHPDLSAGDEAAQRDLDAAETMVVQFALDDPPFVPDLRLSELTLMDKRYPVVNANYYAWAISYDVEYFCRRVDRDQSVLFIRCTLTNDGEYPQGGHVRVKVNFQKESALFDNHFVPFNWEASKWLPCHDVSLDGETIRRGDSVIGRILPGGFDWEWAPQASFEDGEYNQKFSSSRPYFVTPQLRLKEVQDVIHFHTQLEPEQEKSLCLALLVNCEKITEEHGRALAGADPDECWVASVEDFQELCDEDRNATLACESADLEGILTELQISTLQLLADLGDGRGLAPTRGGSSERSYVWGLEAVDMLRPMLRLGRLSTVRRALDFLLSLQDGGRPPEGDFTTLEGAIGTTGAGCINSTGAVLGLAAEYYAYAHDKTFLDEHLSRILKATDWIVGQITATRTLSPDGTRPPTYGLMPSGRGTERDVGCMVSSSDAFTFWGLDKVAELLELIGHGQAEAIRREAESYRGDIRRTIDALIREDGFIERRVAGGEDDEGDRKFDNVCGAMTLAYVGVLDVYGDVFRRYARFVEGALADHYFMGKMDREVACLGAAEHIWQDLYLRLAEWKKAFAAVQVTRKYGMTPHTWQTQERFSIRNAAYTPWQPSGSANGRVLSMIIKSFYFEYPDGRYGDVATLLGGIPFVWLSDNGFTELKGLRTTGGRISLEAEMISEDRCAVVLSADPVEAMPGIVRFPNSFAVAIDSEGVDALGRGYFEIAPGYDRASFTVCRGVL